MEMQKSKEKKVLQVFKPFNFPFFKPDDDDEGGPQNPSFFNNNYIVWSDYYSLPLYFTLSQLTDYKYHR